jgi:hypothetical protein
LKSLCSAAGLFACLVLLPVELPAAAGSLTLKTSDARLAAAFAWARSQALAYAFEGDPVGNWYEAALPGRHAFCMRDTAHQAMGAYVLGLAEYTHNMLYKFAENISESKDWCSHWEINRENRPAPVDYLDDAHFWYNLPANFDVLDACYRMYLWTGDKTYLTDPVFLNFYRRTVHEHVDRWQLGVHDIMSRARIMNFHAGGNYRFQKSRGIPSYDESDPNFVVAIDQVAAQYAGYLAYAQLEQLRGETEEAKQFFARAKSMKLLVNGAWWDKSAGSYYSRVNLEYRLDGHGLNTALLYYGIAEDGVKSASVLEALLKTIGNGKPIGIEGQSHFPEILYRKGKAEAAYGQILDLTREGKHRREYPEVSYAVIGAIATGLMGLDVQSAVRTLPRLTAATRWVELDHVPLRANDLSIRHDGLTKTTVTNSNGPSVMWRACFPGSYRVLWSEGKAVSAREEVKNVSCSTVNVSPGTTKVVYVSR